jgi:acetylglutamate kinase
MEESGLKASFVKGLRVTDEATIAIVKKTLDEVVNRDVCEARSRGEGGRRGFPGDSVLVCQKLETDDDGNAIDLGFVGEVTEVKVKLIKKEIADGFVPGHFAGRRGLRRQALQRERGPGRRAGGERAAGAPALLHERRPRAPFGAARPASLISTLKISQVDELKKKGVIDKGMRRRSRAPSGPSRRASSGSISSTGAWPHSLLLEIFTDKGIGTEIVHG